MIYNIDIILPNFCLFKPIESSQTCISLGLFHYLPVSIRLWACWWWEQFPWLKLCQFAGHVMSEKKFTSWLSNFTCQITTAYNVTVWTWNCLLNSELGTREPITCEHFLDDTIRYNSSQIHWKLYLTILLNENENPR